MDGENDGASLQTQGAGQQAAQGNQAAQQQQASLTVGPESAGAGGVNDKDTFSRARTDYKRALAKRDAKIAELEGEVAQAPKTAEAAKKPRAEMNELKLASARNIKTATALLADHGSDISKLKEAELWLFGGGKRPRAAARRPS